MFLNDIDACIVEIGTDVSDSGFLCKFCYKSAKVKGVMHHIKVKHPECHSSGGSSKNNKDSLHGEHFVDGDCYLIYLKIVFCVFPTVF